MFKSLHYALFLGATLCSTPLFALNNNTTEKVTIAEEPGKNQLDEKTLLEKVKKMLPKIYGYVQTGYNYGNSNGDNASSFKVNRFRLFIDKEINKTFDLRVQTELYSGSIDGSKYNKRVMTVLDAYLNINIDKRFKMRVGQYFVPLGFENYNTSPSSLETVNFSDIAYRIECRNPISTPYLIDYGRDVGLMIHGDFFENKDKGFSYIHYALSVANGSVPTLNDDNKSKDIIGRLMVQPVKNLRLLGSYSWGESQGLGTSEQMSSYTPLHRMVVGAWYQTPSGFNVRSEYGTMTSNYKNQNLVDEYGFYALVSQKFGKFTPVLKYELYRDNKLKTSAVNRDQLVAGVTYEFNNSVKLQLNYGLIKYQDEVIDAGVKSGIGDSLNAVFLVKF